MRKPYPSDINDEQWENVRDLIPVNRVGRPRQVDMREVLNTILYQARSGCQWDMLPHDLLPKSTVYDHFTHWREHGIWQSILAVLRVHVRVTDGRELSPPEEPAPPAEEEGREEWPASSEANTGAGS
jgi:putative transposase